MNAEKVFCRDVFLKKLSLPSRPRRSLPSSHNEKMHIITNLFLEWNITLFIFYNVFISFLLQSLQNSILS